MTEMDPYLHQNLNVFSDFPAVLRAAEYRGVSVDCLPGVLPVHVLEYLNATSTRSGH